MFQHSLKHWREFSPDHDALADLERSRGAALARGDYSAARDYRLTIQILAALKEATAQEIKSGAFFDDN